MNKVIDVYVQIMVEDKQGDKLAVSKWFKTPEEAKTFIDLKVKNCEESK